VAGFVLNSLGKLPENGESFDFGKYTFEVLERKNYRIERVIIRPKKRKKTVAKKS